ncbi:M20 aminoacylase family protein [Bradyrhizobium sp. LHD-71]|uniref:M20 aminoacylase family protein n=1 Tax=Bradyrhizobium sp. LHD-71 TaxID=3072141 RepID=UPI00280CD5D8|nr:M20 aminoacylase family protein [Bradyrhizobium sp. LHD-71]MDQ8730777.1 M20 aminoacylase family protein [Bradyrhizobium sp. LHD-71]
MPVIERINHYQNELVAIRHDLHAHPEIGFEEVRTSNIVADLLEKWGITVHRGIGGTGVVGELKGRHDGNRRIGLRADMDALPIQEETGLPYASTAPGKMHACGHDGHTTILLGAARYLAETRDFAGTAVFVFQPAEEGLGGARAMLQDGLFKKFPCDEIYGLHNAPNRKPGRVAVFPGAAMAGADFFDFHIKGRGSHGARPNEARDPIIAAVAVAQALQTIVSRNNHPRTPLVVSVTQIHAGSAYNVIPADATISGTVRAFSDDARALVRKRMKEIAAGVAATYGVDVEVSSRDIFTVLENHPEQTEAYADVAREIVGDENLSTAVEPVMGSEDFADMLRVTPGAYCWVGHACDKPVHNPEFVFDDAIIPIGASLMARIVERRLSPSR